MSAPEKKFNQKGGITASVWKNSTRDGESFRTVSIERRYKDRDGEWKSTNSFSSRQLQSVIVVLAQVSAYLEEAGETVSESGEKSHSPPTSRCRRCHRMLRLDASVARGWGSKCWAQLSRVLAERGAAVLVEA